MKVEIDKNGSLVISAETGVEKFALTYIGCQCEECPKCGYLKLPIIINTAV